MAFVVTRNERHGRRFEIRESSLTPAGPRARTLATFRVLSEEVLDRAAARARHPFDRGRIVARAAALEIPRTTGSSARAARDLIAGLRREQPPGPALVAWLRRELPRSRATIPDSLEPALEWLGASDERRGRALRDLLRLADRIPRRRRPEDRLAFPGFHPPRR